MGDKLANVLIVIIIILILGLGGIYYTKVSGNYHYTAEEQKSYSEMLEEEINSTINTPNGTLEDTKVIIDKNSATVYPNNNRYYYNYLEAESKAIYDAIVNHADELKSGNQTINIDYDFNQFLNNENGEQLLEDYYNDAINAINLDVPNLFYLDFSKMSLNIKKTSNLFSTKYKLYLNNGNHENYFLNGFTSNAQVEVAISQMEVAKNQVKIGMTGTDYRKMRVLHDWLIDYMEYEGTSINRASVYGAMMEKKGVCEAYARTYKYILDDFGIENILVTGTATNSKGNTEDHMWNYVKLNDKWYAIDPTWDDPIIIGGGTPSEETKHKYFLKGSQDFYKNHAEKMTISSSGKIFTLPKLEVTNY